MATRTHFENAQEVGSYLVLTNRYCLVAAECSETFYNSIGSNADVPVIPITISGTKIIGNMCVGNSNGLLVPSSITDEEWQVLRNSLPEEIQIEKVNDKLSALGNIIVCNDFIALVHPDVEDRTLELITDVLKVQVYKMTIGGSPLVGSYCVLTNKGGMLRPVVGAAELDQLSSLLRLPLCSGTVNRGVDLIGSGLVASDTRAFCGSETTGAEVSIIDAVFSLGDNNSGKDVFASEDREELLKIL